MRRGAAHTDPAVMGWQAWRNPEPERDRTMKTLNNVVLVLVAFLVASFVPFGSVSDSDGLLSFDSFGSDGLLSLPFGSAVVEAQSIWSDFGDSCVVVEHEDGWVGTNVENRLNMPVLIIRNACDFRITVFWVTDAYYYDSAGNEWATEQWSTDWEAADAPTVHPPGHPEIRHYRGYRTVTLEAGGEEVSSSFWGGIGRTLWCTVPPVVLPAPRYTDEAARGIEIYDRPTQYPYPCGPPPTEAELRRIFREQDQERERRQRERQRQERERQRQQALERQEREERER